MSKWGVRMRHGRILVAHGEHMTTDLILAFHLIGLMMGAGGGFASAITMRAAAKLSPDQAATLHTLAIRSRAGTPRKVLQGIVDVTLDVICGVDSRT